MITCKICEKEVLEDLLGPHSQKCREVNEYKEALTALIANMEIHSDKATSMKNSLETYATKQQKRHSKKGSSRDLLDVSIAGHCKNSANVLTVPSNATLKSRIDTELSEEDKMDRTLSTFETVETQDDLGKRMNDEERLKVLDEAKKSMIVLKKVILYAKSIADWALDLTSVCDVDVHTQNELETHAKEIVDANVLNFLQIFITDIESYLTTKEKYVNAINELATVSSPAHSVMKPKVPLKKSVSFRNKADGGIKGSIFSTFKAKSDETPKKKDSPSTDKRKLSAPIEIGTASPSAEKRKLLVGLVQAEAGKASPRTEKRRMSSSGLTIEVNGEGLLQSKKGSTRPLPRGLETTKSSSVLNILASPSMKSLKGDLSKNLLQTNVNHMSLSHLGVFATPRQQPSDTTSLRDKIKASVNLGGMEKSPRNANVEHGLMSPGFASMLSQKKDGLLGRKSISKAGPTMTPVTAFGQQAKKSGSATPGGKAGNMGWFKSIRSEDTAVLSKFAPANQNQFKSNGPSNGSSFDDGTPRSKNGSFLESPGLNLQNAKSKKEEVQEFFDSPTMKGYYSDCNASRSKRRISRLESNELTVEDFEFIKYIGKGAYGTVWLVKKKATGAYYAMKMVEWADRGTQNRMKALKAEKDIYQALEGDFVVKALWTFHYDNFICFVTEYMLGGDFSKILDRVSRLDEPQAQFYFAELVLAIESLHKLNVVHRDLKPENILMDEKGHIRLTDFGLSQIGIDRLKGNSTPSRNNSLSPEDAMAKAKVNMINKMCKNSPAASAKGKVEFRQKKRSQTIFNFLGKEEEYQRVSEKKPLFSKKNSKESPAQGEKKSQPKMVGTPDYMAPEVIAQEKYNMEGYDEKSMDWWSMGVILYQLLVGIPPFCDNTIEKVFDNIKGHKIEFPPVGDEEDCISEAAYDLINKLLNPDFRKRLGSGGVDEVKSHRFFKGIDWATLREREAPIIPCSLEETLSEEQGSTPMTAETSAMNSPAFGIRRTKTVKPIEFGGFQMRRLDLLDQANQQTHKELIRQKSGKIKL